MSSSACAFSLLLEGCIQSLVPRTAQVIRDAGGSFSGDTRDGQYVVPTPLGEIRGVYRIEGVCCDLCITDMPTSFTCDDLRRLLMKAQRRMQTIELEG